MELRHGRHLRTRSGCRTAGQHAASCMPHADDEGRDVREFLVGWWETPRRQSGADWRACLLLPRPRTRPLTWPPRASRGRGCGWPAALQHRGPEVPPGVRPGGDGGAGRTQAAHGGGVLWRLAADDSGHVVSLGVVSLVVTSHNDRLTKRIRMMTRKHGPLVSLVSLNIHSARGPEAYPPPRARTYSGFRVTRVTKSQKPTVRRGIRGESRISESPSDSPESHQPQETNHACSLVAGHPRRTRMTRRPGPSRLMECWRSSTNWRASCTAGRVGTACWSARPWPPSDRVEKGFAT